MKLQSLHDQILNFKFYATCAHTYINPVFLVTMIIDNVASDIENDIASYCDHW